MEANKKYKLTDETIEYNGHILHRIEALKDFGYVKKGDLGGYVESESNLSQEGKCWVGGNAKVYENSKVFVNAKVIENAWIYDNAGVYGNAEISGDANVRGYAIVCENAKVYDNANINGNSRIFGNSKISGNSSIEDNAAVFRDAQVFGDAKITGNAEITGDAEVSSIKDYAVFKNNWSSGRYFTWTKSNDMWKVGCFYGTGKQLIEKAYSNSEESGKLYEVYVNLIKQIS